MEILRQWYVHSVMIIKFIRILVIIWINQELLYIVSPVNHLHICIGKLVELLVQMVIIIIYK